MEGKISSFLNIPLFYTPTEEIFGGKKIPELMKGLGQGIREFKDASNGTDKDKKTNPEEQPKG